jgi:hypothetical protein
MKTINAPTKKGNVQISGKVALLYVGQYRHKFLLQETPHNEVFLTDYASGCKIGSLTPIKIGNFKSYHRMTDRAAAIELLERKVTKHGANKVNELLNAAPTINH